MSPIKTVVCMGAPADRTRVTRAVEGHGDVVLAECDTAFEASEVAQRFHADALIVETIVHLSLGQDLLTDLERPDRPYFVILVRDMGSDVVANWPRVTVIDRHDDVGLAAALERIADPRGEERRQPMPAHFPPREGFGLYDPESAFYSALAEAGPGDVIIAMSVGDETRLDALATACRLAIRSQDYVTLHAGRVVALLQGGNEQLPGAALARIGKAWLGPESIRATRRTIGEGDLPGDVFLDAALSLRESEEETTAR